MRLRDQYDWVVLGSDPGALISASLAARLGLSVLILPMAPILGFQVSHSGQYFDPESNYLLGLGKLGKVDGLIFECLSHLGLLTQEEQWAFHQNSMPQVVTPTSRLTFAEQDRLPYEFQRELGKPLSRQLGLIQALKQTESDFISFWQSLPRRLTLNAQNTQKKASHSEIMTLNDLRRRLNRNLNSSDSAISSWGSDRKRVSEVSKGMGRNDFLEISQGLWFGITSSLNPDPALFDLLHILSLSRVGGAFKGGLTAYRNFLLDLARRLGVHIPIKVECRRIFVEKGRFAGVQITSRGNAISGGSGVLGCSLNRAFQRVTYTGRSWFPRRKKVPVPQGWKFTIAFTVHRKAIPVGMLSRVVWQEKDAPVLEIEVVDPSIDYQANDSDHRFVYLRTLMPFQEESLKLDYQRLIAGRMMRQALEILPFMNSQVKKIYPDFRIYRQKKNLASYSDSDESGSESSSSNELAEVYGFTSLETIPDNLIVFAEGGVGSRSGIDGLYVASTESYPEFGSLGGVIAAIESVAAMAHRIGLTGPFV